MASTEIIIQHKMRKMQYPKKTPEDDCKKFLR